MIWSVAKIKNTMEFGRSARNQCCCLETSKQSTNFFLLPIDIRNLPDNK